MVTIRLWHEQLLPYLSQQRILGQHRECCAMRGNGWGQDHSTVNYVWNYSPQLLTRYHNEVMAIGYEQHGINFNDKWTQGTYRGKSCDDWHWSEYKRSHREKVMTNSRNTIYPEHDYDYLVECIENLEGKDVDMSTARDELLDK